jgi:hypothetical protein
MRCQKVRSRAPNAFPIEPYVQSTPSETNKTLVDAKKQMQGRCKRPFYPTDLIPPRTACKAAMFKACPGPGPEVQLNVGFRLRVQLDRGSNMSCGREAFCSSPNPSRHLSEQSANIHGDDNAPDTMTLRLRSSISSLGRSGSGWPRVKSMDATMP